MTRIAIHPLRALTMSVALVVGPPALAQPMPPRYGVQSLGLDAAGINAIGQVVGTYNHDIRDSGAFSWSAAVWTPGEGRSAFQQNGWGSTTGIAINDAGAFVGYQQCCGQSFLWRPGSGATGLSGPGFIAFAHDVNNAGQAVGESEGQAILWDAQGRAQVLGPGAAHAINEQGQVVGQTRSSAFVWSPEQGLQVIGAGTATDINDRGEVVGVIGGSPSLWTAAGGLRPLAGAAAYGATPEALNNAGMVVGRTAGGFGFVWTEEAGLVDLNTLLGPAADPRFPVVDAVDVNDDGLIAANQRSAGSFATTGLLLTPIPEPAAPWLLAAGAAWLLLAARRRASRASR